ncbi:MAG: selenium metabolism-associated LysR family transcriptional regulator [Planctomycetota bacterium]|jgi:DNA-binding transcriptional LysR family regulator
MPSTDPLSIRQLEVFVALLERGSFTRAAQHLQLSQSTVSGHVADLERRLGVRLVERERSGVQPTAAGDALLRPAREVLQAERNARMAVEELAGLLKGTLVVGGSTIPASYLLPEIFARFHAAHPGVALRLWTGDSREILERVGNADVEVGVVGAPPGGADLESTRIGEDRLTLILPPDHELAARATITVSQLLAHGLVMREEGSGTRAATERALTELLGPKRVGELRVASEVGSTEAVKAAVRAGLGLAFVSSLSVGDELESGKLASVRVRGFDVKRSFFLVTRPESLLSPAARAFCRIALGDR